MNDQRKPVGPAPVLSRTRRVLRGVARVPTSKPHSQRAGLLAALAEGESLIRRPNLCSESAILQQACEELGAVFTPATGPDGPDGTALTVQGVGGRPRRPTTVLRTAGSGFALRHLMAVTSLAESPCVLTGDLRLAARPLEPLKDALTELGGRLEYAAPELVLPLVNWSGGLAGGEVTVPAHETSQFVSALLLVAPYAARPVRVRVPGAVVGGHYIRMTLDMMRRFGAETRAQPDLGLIEVRPGGYTARELTLGPDVTALFSLIAAAVVADTDVRVQDVLLGDDALLDAAVALGRRLGVRISQEGPDVRIVSGPAPAGPLDIDATDLPTLVPALAAVAAHLPNGLRLRGARHVQHHKTSRLAVMIEELAALGMQLRPIHRDGALDGFETGHLGPPATRQVSSFGDHRNYMALYLAALTVPEPVVISGEETLTMSFADFHACFSSLMGQPAAL
ncbi:MAG: 3-phosphoshikimate 1-carboxyvinyltransferase [Pseudonocardiaceae bacterium]